MTYTKRAVVLLLALMMVFTGAVQAFAATQMTMAVIALPRAADTNKGDWGLQDTYLLGGWGTVATESYFVYCKDSHSGQVVYCIEPGHSVRTGNILSQTTDSSYWANYPGGKNPTLTPDGVKTVLGRLLQYGWRGNGNTSWNTSNASHRQDIAELIATQMLVWEVVVGERTLSFSHVDATRKGFDSVMDNIATGNPLYDDIWEAYESIEYAVQHHTLLPSFMSDNQITASNHELVWNGSRYEITLTDTNGVLRECGLKTDSNDLKCEISGNKITFYTTNPNVSEILVVAEKEASKNNFLVWTDGRTASGDQDVISYGQEVNETLTGYLKLSITASAAGNVKIIKTAEDDNVSFVEFNIKGEGLNTTAFTDENGEILLEGLTPGEYTITEASYSKYKAQQPQTVIVENGKTAVAQFHNEMNYGAMKIVKTADDGNVAGIQFHIGLGEEQTIDFDGMTVTTDANGEIHIPNLESAVYIVSEVTPDGYTSNPASREVFVNWGETAAVNFHNELKKGNLEIIKTSEDGNIEGINFTINTGKPMAKRTLENLKKVSSSIFAYARANNLPDIPDFFKLVMIPKNSPVEYRRALTETEQQWIIETEHRAQLPAMIMMFAGLRRGEVIPLMWSDIDLHRGFIHVTRSVEFEDNNPIVKQGGKSNNAVRFIPIPPILVEYLKKVKQDSSVLSKYVCTSASGNLYTKSAWRRMWDSYMTDLNLKYGYENEFTKFNPNIRSSELPMKIEPFTPHYLRHTFATLLYLENVNVVTAKQILGHADISTTVNIYTDLNNFNKFMLSESYIHKLNNEYAISA